MPLEFGLTDELTTTRLAPLAALGYVYRHQGTLKRLQSVQIQLKEVHHSPQEKLAEVLVSILAGCEHLFEINTVLRPDTQLAQTWGQSQFAEQSVVSRTLDALTQMNVAQLRAATTAIWREHSQVWQHDWRGWLWLDLDLSGLLCSAQAEGGEKGYFSGEKTLPDANWRAFQLPATTKRSGPRSFRAVVTARRASNRRC